MKRSAVFFGSDVNSCVASVWIEACEHGDAMEFVEAVIGKLKEDEEDERKEEKEDR